MRIETKSYKIYKVNELTPEAFENAKRWYLEDEWECQLKTDMFYERITDEMEEKYGIKASFHFSLSYSQGDGLSFDCDYLLTDRLLEEIEKDLTAKDKKILEYIRNVYCGKFISKNTDNYYCYGSANDVDYDFSVDDVFYCYKKDHKTTRYTAKDFEETTDKVLSLLREWYCDLCKDYEQQGYDEIYYEETDAEFIDICEGNGWEFYEDGRLY